ncbi:MAG TPA: phosphatase PAP2 family protein [Roseomonas sp.]|jgi:hypothetical protein
MSSTIRRPSPPSRSVPPVSRKGEPPRPPQRTRWGAVLVMLLGVGGFLLILAVRRGGDAIGWNKWLVAEIARQVALTPDWAPDALRDIAALGSPTVLAVLALLLFLGATAREGLGAGIGVLLTLGLAAAVTALLKIPFILPGPAAPDLTAQLLETGFPSANALFAGLLWARLLALPRGGAFMPFLGWLLGGLACLARISLGQHVPDEVVAGLCAALAFLGATAWVVPGDRLR